MKDKLICFMILILFAVTFFVMAKETTTIVCNNVVFPQPGGPVNNKIDDVFVF